jgi:hypothetical protein
MLFPVMPTLDCPQCHEHSVRWVSGGKVPYAHARKPSLHFARCRECGWEGQHEDEKGRREAQEVLEANVFFDRTWFDDTARKREEPVDDAAPGEFGFEFTLD